MGGGGGQVMWPHVGKEMVSLACYRRSDSSAEAKFTNKKIKPLVFPPVFPAYNITRFPSSDRRAPLSERLEQAMVS